MISLVILPTICHTLSFIEFGIESNDSPLIDIFLNSHHLFTRDCVNILRRNSVLVTTGSERVKSLFGHLKLKSESSSD